MKTHGAKAFQSSFGTIIQINFKLLFAVVFALVAWVLWPINAKWLGLGVISIFMALAALSLVIEAVRLAIKLYVRDKTLAEFEQLGNRPQSSTLVSEEVLRDAGLIDE